MEGLDVTLGGLRLGTPLVSASGIYGLDYERLAGCAPWMSAAVTKTVTLHPRAGNPEPRIAETRAGMLNAIGLQNPGIAAFAAEELPKLRALEVPVIASVAGSETSEYVQCAEILNAREEVHAIELNVSCPNVEKGGIEFGSDASVLEELVAKVKKAVPGKTLIVKLTPNVTDIAATAQAAIDGGANALCIINTLRGMAIDVERQKPTLANRIGGLSGIGIHPVAVYAVYRCYTACCKKHNVAIIGLGGVTNAGEALELILAGATCVGIGTAMFRAPGVFADVAKGLLAYMKRKGIGSISEIIGKAVS
ncbi:MAG: dihydroorotate dehydrogenase [Anaerolineales bacterium]|nr:dihydroorotate dehydrogenase [Anaerolineales bacterium]